MKIHADIPVSELPRFLPCFADFLLQKTRKEFSMIKYKKNNIDLMFELGTDNAISVTDCTGLIPFAPVTEYEYHSYNQIINYRAKDANTKNIK